MNEILAEKLEVVIDQFEQFNGGKINAVGSKMEELETSMASLQKSLAEIKIPEEVMLRHEHHKTVDYKNENVWVKVMSWVSGVSVVGAIVFCSWFYHVYKVNEETAIFNERKKADYGWLMNYYNYMSDKGAPNTTEKYIQSHPIP
jgi:hypothetical protein